MSNDLKELTTTLIQTQVVKALKDAPEYIETLIGAALNEPVNIGSGYDKKMVPWLQNKVNNIIQIATEQVVRERIQEMMPTIREKVAERLSTDTIIDAFTSAIQAAAKDNYRINVSFGKDNDR